MAHECPNCGMVCHCNGDIDDLLLNDEDDLNNCTCCDGEEGLGEDGMGEEGCLYPDKCVMPGPHLTSECHTAEMIEAEREDALDDDQK